MILSVKQVAELLGCEQQAVYARVYRGALPAKRWGRKIVFIKKDLEEFLDALPPVVPNAK